MAEVNIKETKHNDPNKMARRAAFDPTVATDKPQEFYEEIKAKFAEERDKRLNFRPQGLDQYTSDLTGGLAKYESDPWAEAQVERDPIEDHVECLFIGGGFSALLPAARLRERGVESFDKSGQWRTSDGRSGTVRLQRPLIL